LKRCLKYKRRIEANKKLTVVEIQLDESKRRIVGYQESEKALAQKSLIESAIQKAMEETKKWPIA